MSNWSSLKGLSVVAIVFSLLAFSSVHGAGQVYSEIWNFNSLTKIGGYSATVRGNPRIVSTEYGEVVGFDGEDDQLLIAHNPIGDSKVFTVEIVFKPGAGINRTNDPRFFHIEDPNDLQRKRFLMEMRLNDQNQWAFDGFLQTDKESLVLFDETKTHPANEWTHVAVVYNGSIMKTFVNGKEELRGTIGYNKAIVNALAKTSVGSRMNEKNWLLGFVKTARITHAAVDPKDFMPIHQTAIHEPYIPVRQNLIQCRYRGDGQIALDMCESITMPVQIQIMTAAGKRVLSALYPGTAPYMLNIDGLTNGFYLITADGETSSFSQKIRILR